MVLKEAGSVLVLTDLTRRSEPAMPAAGRMAEDFGCTLDVLHAMGLEGAILTRAVPVLNRIQERIA